MRYQVKGDSVTITCTARELCQMDLQAGRIYVRPTSLGEVREIYISSRTRYPRDFTIAAVEDFCSVDELGDSYEYPEEFTIMIDLRKFCIQG